MAEDPELDLPLVQGINPFSVKERKMLEAIAGEHDLELDEVIMLIEKERAVEGMGRRHGIHQSISSHIHGIARRRLDGAK